MQPRRSGLQTSNRFKNIFSLIEKQKNKAYYYCLFKKHFDTPLNKIKIVVVTIIDYLSTTKGVIHKTLLFFFFLHYFISSSLHHSKRSPYWLVRAPLLLLLNLLLSLLSSLMSPLPLPPSLKESYAFASPRFLAFSFASLSFCFLLC